MTKEQVQSAPGRFALSVGETDMPAPEGWAWVRLQDVARLESGHTPSRSHPEYWNGDVPWIGIKDARENHGRTIVETNQKVTQAGIDNSAARRLPPGTVCLSRTASVGYVTVMGREMATSQDFVNWVCSDALVPDFLKYLLLAEGEDTLRSFGKGSVHTTIYFPEVEEFRVCVPGVARQRRIVAKLDALLARGKKAREHLDRIPALLDALKRSILAAAFRGDLTADWRKANPEVEPATKLLERIRAERRRRWEEELRAKGKDQKKAKYEEPAPVDETELPELPEGWCWATVGELVADIEAGRSPSTEGRPAEAHEPGVLKVSAVTWGEFDPAENKRLLASDRLDEDAVVRAGDLLISRANTAQLVGAVVLVQEDHPNLMLSDKILRLVTTPTVNKSFLLYAMRTPLVRELFEGDATGTSDSMRNLTQDKIRATPIAVAPAQEQAEICRLLDVEFGRVKRLVAAMDMQRRGLSALESSTLGAAFRGELVPQDPNDEPADVMLARLRATPPAPAAKAPRAAPRAKRPAPASQEAAPSMGDALDVVVGALVAAKRMTAEQVRAATGLDKDEVTPVLRGLVAAGKVRVEGKARGTAYVWAG